MLYTISYHDPPFEVYTFEHPEPPLTERTIRRYHYLIFCDKCGTVWARVVANEERDWISFTARCSEHGGGAIANTCPWLLDMLTRAPIELVRREFINLYSVRRYAHETV